MPENRRVDVNFEPKSDIDYYIYFVNVESPRFRASMIYCSPAPIVTNNLLQAIKTQIAIALEMEGTMEIKTLNFLHKVKGSEIKANADLAVMVGTIKEEEK